MLTPVFYTSADDYTYTSLPQLPFDSDLYFPVEVDTEYYQPAHDFNKSTELNTTITVQYRAISLSKGMIYSHKDVAHLSPRHPTANTLFSLVSYLQDLGYTVSLHRQIDISSDDYRTLTIDLYTFFAVAELYRIFGNEFLADIDSLCLSRDKQGIEQARRVRTFNKQGTFYADYVFIPWICNINGINFRLALRIFDTSAVHGVANYASFCSNSGLHLEFKEVFSKANLSDMLNMYFTRPDDFDNYALGDLYNHQALIGNAEKFLEIYKTLGLQKYYTLPRLTIGSTVNKLFEACIKKLFQVASTDRSPINKYCYYSSADYLKNLVGTTAPLNAKVDGGRCRNNRPLDFCLTGTLCDIDIASCYGDGLRSQLYPFGKPMILDYPSDSDRNKFLTLREFLKDYSQELVPGLWQARVSLKLGVTLNYSQDFLTSWIPPKDIRRMPTDTEFAMTDEWYTLDNVGETKIFTNEIRYAVITHDFLQWLDNVATARQKKELLDNLQIITAAFYPKSQQVSSPVDLLESYALHKGENTTRAVSKSGNIKKVSINQECYKWYAVNLGDFLVTKLITERVKYPKEEGLNQLYKLCTNTVYGDMVSPFFKVGNVVVGNNITARARSLCWYMEKGFYGVQSITDGCVFDINRVCFPRNNKDRLTGENTTGLYASINDSKIFLSPLQISGVKVERWKIVFYENKPCLVAYINNKPKFYTYKRSLKIINKYAFDHLKKLFPNIDILHLKSLDVRGNARIGLYEFETKSFFIKATFHATANYSLYQYEGSKDNKYAMRSYQRHTHNCVAKINDTVQIISTDYQPSKEFLDSLQNPNSVNRSHVFIRRKILKLGDYRRNYTKWKETKVFPGMTIETPSLLREFSLTQFTYKNYNQFVSWRKQYQQLLKKYGQSYEQFFMNEDGSIDYAEMCKNIDLKIRTGKQSFFEDIDRKRSNTYRLQSPHIALATLNEASDELISKYNFSLVDSSEESEIFYGDSDE